MGVGTNVDRLIFRSCHAEFWKVIVTYRSYLSGLPGIFQCTDIETLNTYSDGQLVFNVKPVHCWRCTRQSDSSHVCILHVAQRDTTDYGVSHFLLLSVEVLPSSRTKRHPTLSPDDGNSFSCRNAAPLSQQQAGYMLTDDEILRVELILGVIYTVYHPEVHHNCRHARLPGFSQHFWDRTGQRDPNRDHWRKKEERHV